MLYPIELGVRIRDHASSAAGSGLAWVASIAASRAPDFILNQKVVEPGVGNSCLAEGLRGEELAAADHYGRTVNGCGCLLSRALVGRRVQRRGHQCAGPAG